MSYDESMKVSFKESIIRICGEQIKDFVTSCLGERGYTLVGIRSHYFTVLDTVGATVIFSLNVRCLCSCERGGEGELSLFFQGSWDITKKASGMKLEKLQKDNPRYKSNGLQYGDDLIPYVKKEKYKDVADLFLKKVYGDFFTNSSKITSALDIAWTLGLTVKMIHLPANMLGKIICRESIVSSTVPKEPSFVAAPGTILVDIDKASFRGRGVHVATIVHECFHWVFHLAAFELACLYYQSEDGITCMKSGKAEGLGEEVNPFMEIQTLGVVPRVLVNPTLVKNEAQLIANEFYAEFRDRIKTLEHTLDEIAERYGMTKETMKRILVDDCGLESFRGINVFLDDNPIQSYCFTKGSLASDETFDVPPSMVRTILKNDAGLQEDILSGEYVYVDGHFVKGMKKYVSFEKRYDPSLTDYALLHGDECFLKFQISYEAQKRNSSFSSNGMERAVNPRAKKLYLAKRDENLPEAKHIAARKAWRKHVQEYIDCFGRTLGQTLTGLLDHFKLKKTDFDEYGVSDDQIGRICNDEVDKPRLRTLTAIAIKLDMPYQVYQTFIEKAGYDFYGNKKELELYRDFMEDDTRYDTIEKCDEAMLAEKIKPFSANVR